ncbi:MAG: hypothetical protein GF417_12875 [Candidatus Latescibacteria bacterium]|nr:hypothetical protein [bacterium]MBD3425322.1 hypothetical protein [Candidatus Latescibacterota bacterium]
MPDPERSRKSNKRERRNRSLKLLGEVFTRIAGEQYYEALVEPGEKIQLERERDNQHDPWAIRIENRKFRQAGYVPRRISSWLAPLIDAGKVWVEGKAAPPYGAENKSVGTFILLELYLHRKGRRILRQDHDPEGAMEGLHQAVVAIWFEIDQWTDPEAVSALSDQLKVMDTEELLPETRMLLALFRHRAWVVRKQAREREIEVVRETLKRIRIGKAIFYHNLTLFPLISGNGGKPEYVLLKDAIEKEKAEVREVSESGSIPELLVENRADSPILIPEGEILIGAKQNRTVNVTILVAEKTEHVIPVSCVEQNRWSWKTETLNASHYATPGLRGGKIASSQASRRSTGRPLSDQAKVWEDIAMSISAAGADSKTGSITDALEAAKERTAKYRQKLVLPEESSGILFVIGDEVLGMDLFDSRRTLRKLWPRLSESYFFEAALKEKRKKALKSTAKEFIRGLPGIVQMAEKPSGYGRELEFSGQDYAGSGLWYNNRLCHLSAFRIRGGEQLSGRD